jgi:hypothetical protein
MKKVSVGPKQIACLQLDKAHARKYVTNLEKENFTAGCLAQQNIKMKSLKRKNEREREREREINVEVICLLIDKYGIY